MDDSRAIGRVCTIQGNPAEDSRLANRVELPDSEATLSEGNWEQFEVHGHVGPFSPDDSTHLQFKKTKIANNTLQTSIKVNKDYLPILNMSFQNLGVNLTLNKQSPPPLFLFLKSGS